MELQWVPHGLFRWGRPSRTNHLEPPQLGFISSYSGSNKKQQYPSCSLPSLSSHSTPMCPPPYSAQGTQTGTGHQASTSGTHHGHSHPHTPPPPIPTLLPSFPRPGHFGGPPPHHHPTDQQKGTACSSSPHKNTLSCCTG